MANAVLHDPSRIATLVHQGGDPNARGERGISLLQWAVFKHANRGVDTLLGCGADAGAADDTGTTAVHDAARVMWPDVLPIFINHGCDVNVRNTITGAVPLAGAIMARRHPQIDQLLAAHANLELADRMGLTPLLVAAEINALDVVLQLLRGHANPHQVNARGDTLIQILDVTPISMLLPDVAATRRLISEWLATHKGSGG